MKNDLGKSRDLAKKLRIHALNMTHKAKASHIGSCLSMADLLAVLYSRVLRFDAKKPDWMDRDRFILSKGHGAAIAYAVLAECGYFPKEWLETYSQEGSKLEGHINAGVVGVEVSTGSLGHGLSIGCGMALAGKDEKRSYRVFVLLSEGDCNEGSTWEAILFAQKHNLDNLIVIVDNNGLQALGNVKEVMDLGSLAEKFQSFHWAVQEIDGHNLEQIDNVLKRVPFVPGQPNCIIAHTVKGKGVSFMENKLEWHYKSPDIEQLAKALQELENGG